MDLESSRCWVRLTFCWSAPSEVNSVLLLSVVNRLARMPLHIATLPPPGWMKEGILTEVILNLEPPLALDLLTAPILTGHTPPISPNLAVHGTFALACIPTFPGSTSWYDPRSPGSLGSAVRCHLALLARLLGTRDGGPHCQTWPGLRPQLLLAGPQRPSTDPWWCPWGRPPGWSSSAPPGAGTRTS